MTAIQPELSEGPFSADQIKDGDRYELSGGHRLYCVPAGGDHAEHNLSGGALLRSDPDVKWAGVDAGFSPDSGTLRAPKQVFVMRTYRSVYYPLKPGYSRRPARFCPDLRWRANFMRFLW